MYDELYEAWIKERETTEIQPLPKDFYIKLTGYMKKMREESRMLDEKQLEPSFCDENLKMLRRWLKNSFRCALKKLLEKPWMAK